MFETIRRERETHNEIIISYIQIGALLSALLVNLATHALPIAPYIGSNYRLVICVVAIAIRVFIIHRLSKQPSYSRSRKYLISTFDLIVFTALLKNLGDQGAYDWFFVTSFSLCAYTILVILNGLRYSNRVVIYNTAIASLLHTVIFIRHVPSQYHMITAVMSVGMLMPTAFCVGYSVKSLLQMHQESALKEHLERFVSPELVQQMAHNPTLIQRRTERRVATVLFVDIKGFTRLSERLEPEAVVEFLNAFLEEMTTAILQHSGMVDKYIGDAVMGVFGSPMNPDDHALRAFKAGLEMCDRLVHLNRNLNRRGLPMLSLGIGIHTGELLMGTIGSRARLDYTVVGDTVNTAARLESLTRDYNVSLILSEETRAYLPPTLTLYSVDTVQVKNRIQPLTLWSPDRPGPSLPSNAIAPSCNIALKRNKG